MQGMIYTESIGGKTRLSFPKEFYRGEFREGFFVSTNMKHMWAAQMEILTEVDCICRKYDIAYFADCGTLLGAVRHQGFIPWDDDIDIVMLRKEYNRFVSVCERELNERYLLLKPYERKNYAESFVRVIDNLKRKNKQGFDEYHGTPYLAGIDITPLDYLAPDPEEAEIQIQLMGLIDVVRRAIQGKELEEEGKIQNALSQIEGTIQFQFDRSKDLKLQLGLLYDEVCSLYTEEEAEELVLFPYIYEHRNWRFKKEWYRDSVLLPFEGMKVPCPAEYDRVLTAMYGDYHKFVQGTAAHDYPFYKVHQEEIYASDSEHLCRFLKDDLGVFLGTGDESIQDVEMIKLGKKNATAKFRIGTDEYVIRMPNPRRALQDDIYPLLDYHEEKKIYDALRKREVTDDPVLFQKENGYKIAPLLKGAHTLDTKNWEEVAECMQVVRYVHGIETSGESTFDLWECIEGYERLWGDASFYPDYEETKEKIRECYQYALSQPKVPGITHFDLSGDNFLIREQENGEKDIRIIDWEYAGIQDTHLDLAMFALRAYYSKEELDHLLEIYFDGKCGEEIRKKIYCYMAVCGLLLTNYYEYVDRHGVDMTQKQASYHRLALEYHGLYKC